MKYFLSVVALFCTVVLNAQERPLKYVENSFRAVSDSNVAAGAGELGRVNTAEKAQGYRTKFDDDDIFTGMLIVRFQNMSADDVKKFIAGGAKTDGPYIEDKEYKNEGGAGEMRYFIDPTDTKFILTIAHPGTLGEVEIPIEKIESQRTYIAEVRCEKVADVAFTADMMGTEIKLGRRTKNYNGEPVIFDNVPYGTYEVTYSHPDGKKVTQTIEVGDGKTAFQGNVQKKFKVSFYTEETEPVTLTVDGITTLFISKGKAAGVDLVKGAHNITAQNRLGGRLEETITVDDSNTSHEIKTHKSKNVNFTAKMNNTDCIGATVSLDGIEIGRTPVSKEVTYGTHSVNMIYYGRYKTKKFKVDDSSPTVCRLKLPSRTRSFNPFDIDYRKREFGITGGYVQKWYHISDGEGYSGNFNWWLNEGKMSGFQVGVPYQGYFGYGLGMNTGVYFEGYFCGSGDGRTYEEMDIYVPVQAMFRLPLGEEFSLFVNGGIGMDFGIYAAITESGYEDYKLDFGDEEMPNAFQLYGEVGGGIQFKAFQLSAQYSIGLLNNKHMIEYNSDYFVTKPYKLSFTLGVYF